MNPHTNAARKREVEKVCDFLNQRFGYRFGLELALAALGIQKDMIDVMSKLARNRSMDEFQDLLRMHTKGRQ